MAKYSESNYHTGIYKGAEKVKTAVPKKTKAKVSGPILPNQKEDLMREHHKAVKSHLKALDSMMKKKAKK